MAARGRARLGEAGRLLGSLGPEQVLARGYALVQAPDGSIVASAGAAAAQSRLTIRFADGETPVTPGSPAETSVIAGKPAETSVIAGMPSETSVVAGKPSQGRLF